MIRSKEEYIGPMIVDLTGPDGNAWALLGLARRLSIELNLDEKMRARIQHQMKSGDYENLIQVFDRYFGDHVILER